MGMNHDYKNIISIKNLCDAWTEFICGKKSKKDVAEFSLNLSQNIFRLHEDLRTKTYRHGAYEAFSISDPKPRSIHKATVNLTSQLFANVYLNEFDQFVKHTLKTKHYIRYADDFVVVSCDRAYLNSILPLMHDFLGSTLKLSMHPNKVSISTAASGIDFLGWVHFPNHRVLRTTTKKRMFKKIRIAAEKSEVVQSYLGLLSHGDAYSLKAKIIDML